ncbi:MAG: hypothetical protein RLZZ171_1796, partial [Cyanobacteriota bacterium]
VVNECIGRKYQKYLSGEVEHLDWSLILSVEEKVKISVPERANLAVAFRWSTDPTGDGKQPEKNFPGKTATSIDTQGVESVTGSPKNVYKPDSVPVTEKTADKLDDLEPISRATKGDRLADDLVEQFGDEIEINLDSQALRQDHHQSNVVSSTSKSSLLLDAWLKYLEFWYLSFLSSHPYPKPFLQKTQLLLIAWLSFSAPKNSFAKP